MFFLALLHLEKLFIFASTFAHKPGDPCDLGDVGDNGFLFLPHWWQYMKNFEWDNVGQCSPVFVFPGSIFSVGLAILDIMLRIGGLVAVIMVMFSGLKYIMAQGNSEEAGAARRALYNALIGIGIVFTASLVVGFAGNAIAK